MQELQVEIRYTGTRTTYTAIYYIDLAFCLQSLLHFSVFPASGMPSSNEAVLNVARSVKQKYLDLIRFVSSSQSLSGDGKEDDSYENKGGEVSSGQMLLLAFDTLFNNMDAALCELRAAAAEASLVVPEEWIGGVDAVAEAEVIIKEAVTPEIIELLDLTTFMNR